MPCIQCKSSTGLSKEGRERYCRKVIGLHEREHARGCRYACKSIHSGSGEKEEEGSGGAPFSSLDWDSRRQLPCDSQESREWALTRRQVIAKDALALVISIASAGFKSLARAIGEAIGAIIARFWNVTEAKPCEFAARS